MIKFTHVCKEYNKRLVLNDINIKLPREGLIAINGPSGCGKTTLLNLLSGLLPFDGDIEVDGHHLNLMNDKDMDEYRLKNYGFIFQDFKLFETETVLNNIMFPLETISNCHSEIKLKKCYELINLVGLKRNAKQRVNKLSGGEKQRVAIARALVNGPKIILADEPTGALDSETGKQIFDVLKKISAKKLVVVVSHDKESAYKYGDQVIELKDGRIDKSTKCSNNVVNSTRRKLEKSKLPFKNALNFAFASLKKKKTKLFFTVLLSSLSIGMFGSALSLAFFDESYPLEKALSNDDIALTAIGKKIIVNTDIYNIDSKGSNLELISNSKEEKSVLLTPDDISEFKKKGLSVEGIITFNKPRKGVNTINVYENHDYFIEKDKRSYYGDRFQIYGFSDCGKTFCENNFELIAGYYPSSFAEIAISKFEADFLLNSFTDDNDRVFNDYSDIIGKQFVLESNNSIVQSLKTLLLPSVNEFKRKSASNFEIAISAKELG